MRTKQDVIAGTAKFPGVRAEGERERLPQQDLHDTQHLGSISSAGTPTRTRSRLSTDLGKTEVAWDAMTSAILTVCSWTEYLCTAPGVRGFPVPQHPGPTHKDLFFLRLPLTNNTELVLSRSPPAARARTPQAPQSFSATTHCKGCGPLTVLISSSTCGFGPLTVSIYPPPRAALRHLALTLLTRRPPLLRYRPVIEAHICGLAVSPTISPSFCSNGTSLRTRNSAIFSATSTKCSCSASHYLFARPAPRSNPTYFAMSVASDSVTNNHRLRMCADL